MESGLWSDDPHVVLEESFWDEETETATARWYAVDVATGRVGRYVATYQAYTVDGYRELLSSAGFLCQSPATWNPSPMRKLKFKPPEIPNEF